MIKKRHVPGGKKKTRLPKKFRKGVTTSGFQIENKGGRPPYEPTQGDRDYIKKLVAYGMVEDQICSLIESRYGEMVQPETLRKYFRLELKVGTDELTLWAAEKVFNHAKRGSLSAAIFILKTRGRWAAQVNLADPNGNPLAAPNVVVAFGKEEDDPPELRAALETQQ